MLVYAMINNKGGTAKSETAINLAVECGKAGLRTMLVSLDPQSNSTNRILKVPRKHSVESLLSMRTEFDDLNQHAKNELESVKNAHQVLKNYVRKPFFNCDVYDVLLNPKKIHEALIKSTYENLWVLPSSNRLEDAQTDIIKTGRNINTRLKRALKLVEDDFDIVVIDTAPVMNILIYNAIKACVHEGDKIVIPMKIDEGGFEGLEKTTDEILTWLEDVEDEDDELLYDFRILPTMKDRSRIDKVAIETLRYIFKERVYNTSIRYQSNPVKDCSIRAEVLTEVSSKNVAKDYLDFCQEAINEIKANLNLGDTCP